jgi:superfamily II DNA/RNA helicase
LLELLTTINDGSKILIFVEKRSDVDDLTRRLRRDKWNMVGGIHGQKM